MNLVWSDLVKRTERKTQARFIPWDAGHSIACKVGCMLVCISTALYLRVSSPTQGQKTDSQRAELEVWFDSNRAIPFYFGEGSRQDWHTHSLRSTLVAGPLESLGQHAAPGTP